MYAAWITPVAILERIAICFGTESTGVSTEMLEACDRRVYVPLDRFSDSLNMGVVGPLSRLSEKGFGRGGR